MFAIEDEKFPPPKPAVAAHASSTHICVEWPWSASQPLGTTMASSSAGMSSSDALIVVHSRPPNFGTANVYGMRRKEPTRFGTAVSQNCSEIDSSIPTLDRLMTTIVHSTQIEKPKFSAKIENARFLRAIGLPLVSQNPSLSGSQWSIQCSLLIRPPPRGFGGADGRV